MFWSHLNNTILGRSCPLFLGKEKLRHSLGQPSRSDFVQFKFVRMNVMRELMLVRPSKLYAKQVMSYKEEMLQCGDSFDGCAGLEDVQSFDEWIDFERRLREKYKSGYVPSEVFLAVRRKDDFVVGMIDFRHPLSDFLKNFGGNIGYSVRPSERRKGYASEMLGLVLPFCRAFGESKVLVTCDKRNVASQRTIIKNGGVMENEIVDTVGLSKSGIIQRFWISI